MTYAHGEARLNREKEATLDQVVETLRKQGELEVEILGRTDYTGSQAVNERLSKERAMIVNNYLVNAGIAPDRIEGRALWHSDPLRPADPADFRRVNRSAQVKYLCK